MIHRPTVAEIDVDAYRHNIAALAAACNPAAMCAVLKADAYGHGVEHLANAAVEAGATWCAVALVEEGIALREMGIDVPILVLSEPLAGIDELVAAGLTPTVDTAAGIQRISAAAQRQGTVAGLHLKVDTGMHRVGAAPTEVAALIELIDSLDGCALVGFWTHYARADERSADTTDTQLAIFRECASDVVSSGQAGAPILHTANSAAAMTRPETRFDLVRCGIATYGIAPADGIGEELDLRPVLSLRSAVSHLQDLAAGVSVSYGHRHTTATATRLATVPIGYADGVRRDSAIRGVEVLIGGQRYPIVGTVTMDQLLVDLGAESGVAIGDVVTLIGADGDETILANEIAERCDTIGYEVVCDIGARVPRVVAARGGS